MKFTKLLFAAATLFGSLYLTSCTTEESGGVVAGGIITDTEDEVIEGPTQDPLELPDAGATYTINGKSYSATTLYGVSSGAYPARIVTRMDGYTKEINSTDEYIAVINQYGSDITAPTETATGRFYTKEIDGRWWVIDPDGYRHYLRTITSLTADTYPDEWSAKYSSTSHWLMTTFSNFRELGINGSGCFSDYEDILAYSNSVPSTAPIPLTPKFSFLSAFKSEYSLSYPEGDNGDSWYEMAFVLDSRWDAFCATYAAEVLAPYIGKKMVVGFFSDNEKCFASWGNGADQYRLLHGYLALENNSSTYGKLAYASAKAFMEGKGLVASTANVTDDLSSEYSGLIAEKYYKPIAEAAKALDPEMMYLGSRLHGQPKALEGVIAAAGEYCDIISINYYTSDWDYILEMVPKWAEWAPNTPFFITEFYTKVCDATVGLGEGGAGPEVLTQTDRAVAYQHFTLNLLQAKNCVGWQYFKYTDGDEGDGTYGNAGLYDHNFNLYIALGEMMKELNQNAYSIIDYFDN